MPMPRPPAAPTSVGDTPQQRRLAEAWPVDPVTGKTERPKRPAPGHQKGRKSKFKRQGR